jgi:hypothetical protein
MIWLVFALHIGFDMLVKIGRAFSSRILMRMSWDKSRT